MHRQQLRRGLFAIANSHLLQRLSSKHGCSMDSRVTNLCDKRNLNKSYSLGWQLVGFFCAAFWGGLKIVFFLGGL